MMNKTTKRTKAKKTSTKQSQKLVKVAKGHAADAKGLRFEQTVANYYSKQGWQLVFRKRISAGELDICGKRKKEVFEPEEHLLVECKAGERVSAKDVMKFIKKVNVYYRRLPEDLWDGKPPVRSVLAHKGNVDADAKAAAKGIKPRIDFKRFA